MVFFVQFFASYVLCVRVSPSHTPRVDIFERVSLFGISIICVSSLCVLNIGVLSAVCDVTQYVAWNMITCDKYINYRSSLGGYIRPFNMFRTLTSTWWLQLIGNPNRLSGLVNTTRKTRRVISFVRPVLSARK